MAQRFDMDGQNVHVGDHLMRCVMMVLCVCYWHLESLHASDLIPNARVSLEFPELPHTLNSMVTGRNETVRLSAILPINYDLQSKHPLFVYLKGGSGGPTDGGAMAREIVGEKDFIAIQVPLFKKSQPQGRTLPVTLEDYVILSESYRTMFEKLSTTIPNIDWDQSVIGGHSNGAHTLGVLLASNDSFITKHFRNYWFHEGGLSLLPNCLQGNNRRILVLIADDGMSKVNAYRKLQLDQLALLERQAQLMRSDLQKVIMRGYGHDVPPEYMRNVRQFAKSEPLEDIVATQASLEMLLSLPLRSHPDSSGWYDLFVGDLTNARFQSNGWGYRDGVLVASNQATLWTKAIHSDYLLDLEFKLQPSAIGGIMLAGSDKNTNLNSLIVRICDDSTEEIKNLSTEFRCGAIKGKKGPAKADLHALGQWNRMTILVREPSLQVILNGTTVIESEFSRNSESTYDLHMAPGQIAFINEKKDAGIEYRNLKLLRLKVEGGERSD